MDTMTIEEAAIASRIGQQQHMILAFLSWYRNVSEDDPGAQAVGVSLRFLNKFMPLVFGERPSRSSLSRSRKVLEENGYIESYTLGALGMVWEKRRTTHIRLTETGIEAVERFKFDHPQYATVGMFFSKGTGR